jgi:hydroxymethylpyrimidine pyrophosphatase-like HAD family hydrolase
MPRMSSIHIHSWFGDHNTLEGAGWIVRELWGRDLNTEMDRWVYVGDSTNDQLMVQHVEHSVGVAHVARFVPQLQHLPRYVPRVSEHVGLALQKAG